MDCSSEPGVIASGAGALPGARCRCEAGKRTHGPGTRACLAQLAATALLPLAAIAQAQTPPALTSVVRTLLPGGHDAQNMEPLFGLSSVTGSIEITSTEPIVSLSLNFETDPVFSSLPPGELDDAAQ